MTSAGDATTGPTLLGPAEVRALAERLGVRPTKQRGQNFVIDANTVRRIAKAADVGPDDVVLEVGPGLGSLTLALLATGARVTAIEIDPLLASALPETIAELAPAQADRFQVVEADAMRVTEIPGPAPTSLVANLPYNVAVPVLLHLLALLPSLQTGLVMVQSEVADRLAAGPGSRTYGVPSVKAAWYADVRRAGAIGRNVFWPAPNVDSGLVAWTRREPPTSAVSREQVFAVVDAAFAQRRKTIRSALRARFATDRSRCRPRSGRRRPGISRRAARRHDLHPGRRRADPMTDRRVVVSAPAKINLHLGVGRKREDGYHDLVTLYQAIGIYDDITVSASDEPSVSIEGHGVDIDEVPLGGDNIALRAMALLAEHHGIDRCVDVHIDKRIPVAGGMAGGSTDAAGTLLACDVLWDLHTPKGVLLEIAADLGSDVPFCLVGGTALGFRTRRDPHAGDDPGHLLVGGGSRGGRVVHSRRLRCLRPDPR